MVRQSKVNFPPQSEYPLIYQTGLVWRTSGAYGNRTRASKVSFETWIQANVTAPPVHNREVDNLSTETENNSK